MSANRKDNWDQLVAAQTKAWEELLEMFGEIANVLSSNGIPMEDHYDDLDEAAAVFENKKNEMIAFLREWHQEELG